MKIKHACKGCIFIGTCHNKKGKIKLYCALDNLTNKHCPKKCSQRVDDSEYKRALYNRLSERTYLRWENPK